MHLTIFDLDNTLLKTNISFKFFNYLYKKNYFNKTAVLSLIIFFIKFKYFNMDIKELHEKVFVKFLKNKKFSLFTKNIDHFLDKYLDRLFYLPAVLELQKAMNQNHYIAIFSASPDFLVEPICKILKVNEYNATKYALDADNRFSRIHSVIDGEKKAKLAKDLLNRLNIKRKNLSVYSDSIEDLKLFEVAGKKVCVSPCKRLLKLSKKRNWQVL